MIRLDWPPQQCSPNARGHWSSLAKAKAAYRADCAWLAKQAGEQHDGPLLVSVTFRPPDKRRRDLDNALAAIKAGLDGVADAIGVDDRHWALMLAWGEPVTGGAVEVEIRPAPATPAESSPQPGQTPATPP